MTDEELEKEAEEWLRNNLHSASEEDFIKAMVDIAEPRDKRIEELEAQIEKIKTRIKEIIFSNDFVNNSPYQILEKKVKALNEFYKEIKEND